MPGTIILTIDGRKVKVRWNGQSAPTPADVSDIEGTWRKQRSSGAFVGAKAGGAVEQDVLADKVRRGQMTPEAYAERKRQAAFEAKQAKQSAKYEPPTIEKVQRNIAEATSSLTDKLADPRLQAVERMVNPASALAGKKGLTGHAAGLAAGTIMAPVDIAGDAMVLSGLTKDGGVRDKLGAAVNIALKAGLIDAGPIAKMAWKAVPASVKGRFKTAADAISKKLGFRVTPQDLHAGLAAKQAEPDFSVDQSFADTTPGATFRPAHKPTDPVPTPIDHQRPPTTIEEAMAGGSANAEPPQRKPLRAAAHGEPIVADVYHGSPDIRFAKQFDPASGVPEFYRPRPVYLTKDAEWLNDTWFTDDPAIAATYADDSRAFDYQNAEPGVLKRTIALQNPKVIDMQGRKWNLGESTKEANQARMEGYDGVVFKNIIDPHSTLDGKGKYKKYSKPATTVVVFDPKSIHRDYQASTPPKTIEEAMAPPRPTDPVPTPVEQGGVGVNPTVTEPPTAGPAAGAAGPGRTTAHADTDAVRVLAGWDPRQTNPQQIAQWIEESKAHAGKESAIADSIKANPRQATKSEEAALGLRLNKLLEERKAAMDAGDTVAFDLADSEAQKIADALDISGSEWGRQGVARQIVLRTDYTDFGLKRRAQKANLEVPLNEKQAATATEFSGRIEKLEGTMAQIREEVAAALRAGTKVVAKGTAQQRRASALGALRRLGLPTAEAGQETVGIAVKAGKGSKPGAINIELLGADDKVRRAVRQLTKTYFEEGAESIDDVIGRLRQDIPGITDDQALALLSDKYKKAKIDVDTAKVAADRFLRGVRKAAESRQKPLYQKIGGAVYRELVSVQRAFQTALDIGGTYIQGGKAIVENPRAVGRAFVEQLKMIPTIHTQEAFDAHVARLMNDPMYARAKKAGIQFDEFGAAEDFFGEGTIVGHIPGIFKSEAAFKAYKNQLRLEMFKSFAKSAPEDAAHLQSSANLVNVLTGTAQGKFGDLARRAGGVAYAPSYEVSKWQYAMGQPLWNAIAKTGFNSRATGQAAMSYAKQAIVWTAIVEGLRLTGADIDTDIRSSDFGKMTLPGGAQIDLFGKAYSPLRSVGQAFYGFISRKGNYTEPGGYKDAPIERYATGKMAPGPRLGYDALLKGSRYNYDTDQEEPITPKNVMSDMIPLGLKDVYKGWGSMGPLALIALLGAGVGQAKRREPGKSPKIPGDLLPRGIRKMVDGTAGTSSKR